MCVLYFNACFLRDMIPENVLNISRNFLVQTATFDNKDLLK